MTHIGTDPSGSEPTQLGGRSPVGGAGHGTPGDRMRVVDIKRAHHAQQIATQRAVDDTNDLRESVRKIRALHPDTDHGCPGQRIVWQGLRNDIDGPQRYERWSCPTSDALPPLVTAPDNLSKENPT